jgi:hypothetical protein
MIAEPPSLAATVPTPTPATTSHTPHNTTILPMSSNDANQTIAFGVLGLLVAIIGVVTALLQLRHMQRRKRLLEVFELA